MFKLTKNAVSKNLIIFKVFLRKILEFPLCHQILNFEAMLLLMPLLNHCFIEKQGSKKNIIRPISPSNFKIVLILLTEMIAI